MISIKGIILLVLFSAISTKNGSNCPEQIRPCICDKNKNLRCFSSIEFDLEHVFEALAQAKFDRNWNTFELNSPLTTQIEDNIFHGMTFKTIKLNHCAKLTCISPTAFHGMETTLENFFSYNTSFCGNTYKPNCNVFESLRRMRALKSINIIGSKIKEIPDNVFNEPSGHYAITNIDLSGSLGGVITRVGKNAFSYLKNLKYIDLSQHKITKIDWYAFHFEYPSTDFLSINLESNDLNCKSFDENSFALNGRIISLKLGDNPKLEALKESIWRGVLLNNANLNPLLSSNVIDLRGTPLTCCKHNLWLLNNKFSLKRRIHHATSVDTGIDFWLHTKGQCDK